MNNPTHFPSGNLSRKLSSVIAMLIAVSCFQTPVHAQVSSWLNPEGGFYETADNWSVGGVPGPNATTIFGLPGEYNIEFVFDQQVSELLISNNAELTFKVGGSSANDKTYNVSSDATIENAALTFNSFSSGNVNLAVDGLFDITAGELNVFKGAQLASESATLDGSSNGNPTIVEINGTDSFGEPSRWQVANHMVIGRNQPAFLTLSDGAQFNSTGALIADDNYDTGGGSFDSYIYVIGVDSVGNPTTLSVAQQIQVGGNGRGLLVIGDGAFASSGHTTIGGISSEVRVFGEDANDNPSRWNSGELMIRGGRLEIEDGANVTSDNSILNRGATVIVYHSNNANSPTIWNTTGLLKVGNDERGTVQIGFGGELHSETTEIGEDPQNSNSAFFVSGNNNISKWINSGDIFVGGIQNAEGGQGSINLYEGAHVEVGGTMKIWSQGEVNMVDGYMSADSIDNSHGGLFDFQRGTLQVNQFAGNLLNPAGELAPGPDTAATAIIGDYMQQADASLVLEIGGQSAGGTYDLVTVSGASVIDGQLEVTLVNNFTPENSDTFTVLSASSIHGFFDNVTTGQRLSTTDGQGSFVVNYGIGSDFDENRIVLTEYEASGFVPGDVNGDGSVDLLDVGPFVDALVSGTFIPAADINQDGSVDLLDVGPFVVLLGGGA